MPGKKKTEPGEDGEHANGRSLPLQTKSLLQSQSQPQSQPQSQSKKLAKTKMASQQPPPQQQQPVLVICRNKCASFLPRHRHTVSPIGHVEESRLL
jgi:hypothetical protein